MSLCARLDPVTGRLSDIADRTPGAADVPLAAWPRGIGPWIYDATNKVAVAAPLLLDEKLQGVILPGHLIAAIALRSSASWSSLTPAQQATVQAVIDGVGQKVAGLLP